MSEVNVTIEKQGKYYNVDHDVIADVLDARFQKYVKRRGDKIKSGNISVSIHVCEIDPLTSHASFKMKIEGKLNKQSINKTFRQKRAAGGAHNAISLAIVLGTAALYHATKGGSNPFGHGAGGAHLVECIDACMASAELMLDQALGIGESSDAKRWRLIQWVSWIIPTAFVGINTFVLFAQGRRLNLPIISAMMFFPAMFFTVQCIGYLMMSESFFRKDPRGRLAMSRTGVKSMLALRILCVVIILIMSAASVALVALSHVEDKPPRQFVVPQ